MRPIRLILHTHWDREWYLPFERFAERLLPTIDLVLDTMRSDPRLTHFHLDGQVALVDDYIARRPERAAELRSLIVDGRLSCGPWIALVDEFLVSGESIVRSLDDGLRRGDDLGGALRVGYVPDQFGHIGQLPQILANVGIGTAVTWRGVPAAVETGEFLWRSPDGSEVLVSYMPFGYAQGARMEPTEEDFVGRLQRELARSEPWLRDGQPLMLMTGDDHEQMNPHISELVDHARASGVDVVISSLKDSVGRTPASDAPVVVGELRSAARANLLPNTYSVRPHQKVERAGAELILERYAEPLAALVPGFEWPEEALAEAWYLLHLNGAHDSVCGCSTDEVAHAVDQRTRAARAIANRIAHEAFDVLREEVDGKGELVFNMSPFEREGVPPLGWSVDASPAVAAVEVVPVLEDGWLTFNHDGASTSLRVVDQADHGDLYTFEPSGPPSYATDISTQGVLASFSFEGFDAVVRATHHPAEDFMRLHFEVDNRAPDHRVQVEFATPSPPLESKAGSPFEIVSRPAIGEGGDSEPPPRQWPARGFVVAGGACVLGDGVFEYELVAEGIGITLLRCTGTISRKTLAARRVTAGPDVPTPEAQLIGSTARSFGVTSSASADHVGLSEVFSASLMRMPVSPGGSLPARGRLLDLDVPALSAVYRQGDRILVRVWNPWSDASRALIGDRELELGPHRIETMQLGDTPVIPASTPATARTPCPGGSRGARPSGVAPTRSRAGRLDCRPDTGRACTQPTYAGASAGDDGRGVAPTLEWWEMGLRLLAAAALGGLIGFEREYNEQPAGFRTHILVTLGAALFTMAGAYGTAAFVGTGVVRFDPTRVAAQVVTGIGFLGAGAILRYGINIRGLTTAASIWVTASIGVAVALGFWAPALFTTALALISLLFLRPIQRVVLRQLRRSLYKMVVDLEPGCRVAEVNEVLERMGANVRRMRTVGLPGQQRQLILDVEISEDLDIEGVAEQLRSTGGVSAVDWTR